MPASPDLSLETILLDNDRRNISALRPYLPAGFCLQAANLAARHAQRVCITTGFFLPRFNGPETDGPPGALAIGRALRRLGAQISYVSDHQTVDLLRRYGEGAEVISFPITDEVGSRAFAAQILAEREPTLLVSVERCALTSRNRYLNMRGEDISAYTARVDALFEAGIASIGIGDGGNEIGMGNLKEIIPVIPGMPAEPASTRVTALVISSVSNWGSYGLVAALSALVGQDLLPDEREETALLKSLYAAGCYDGSLPTPTCGVDGFTPEENAAVLGQIHAWLNSNL